MRNLGSLSRTFCGGWVKAAALLIFTVSAGANLRAQFTFGTAQDLGNAVSGIVVNDNTGVTADVGAPNIAGNAPNGPLWYKWTAPKDGDVELDTVGSVDDFFGFYPLDTVLGVYQGSALGSLNQVAANDDLYPINITLGATRGVLLSPVTEWQSDYLIPSGGSGPTYYGPSHLRFTAKAGQTYYFATDTKLSAGFYFVIPEGNISLQWSYKSSGVFRFATEDFEETALSFAPVPLYQTAQTESQIPAGTAADVGTVVSTYYSYNAAGCLVTVTRSAGSKGRVTVDYKTIDGDELPSGVPMHCSPGYTLYTNTFYFTNLLGAVIYTQTEVDAGDYTTVSNTLVFDDSEMSKTILVPINPAGTYLNNPNITTNLIPTTDSTAPPSLLALALYQARSAIANTLSNKVFGITLSNPQKDVFEGADVADPRIDPVLSTAEIKILNTAADPYGPDLVPNVTSNILIAVSNAVFVTNVVYFTNLVVATTPTNVLFNFEKANYRVPADVADPSISPYAWADATIYVMRNGSNTAATTVNYRINNVMANNVGVNEFNNQFPLQPGSDYAVPNPSQNNSAVRNYSNTNWDFDGADGTLSFPSSGSGFFYQPIHIRIPVRTNTRFNKDFRIQLYRMQQIGSSTVPRLVGMNSETTITILFNDETPPAGSVDEFYNADYNSEMATLPANRPVTTPIDNSNPGVGSPYFPGQVYSILSWTNDEALIGGDFFTYNGVGRNGIALVQTNGQLDTTFDPGTGISGDISQHGNDSAVNAAGIWGDQFYIAGNFSSYNGTLVDGVARINSDGSIDSSFNPGLGADGTIRTLAVMTNGQIIVGGEFTHINGVTRNYIARLNTDGSVDTTFDPSNNINGPVYTIALPVQPIFFSNTSPEPIDVATQTVRLGPSSSGQMTLTFNSGGTNAIRVYYGNPQAGFFILNTTNIGSGTFTRTFGPTNGFATNALTIVIVPINSSSWSYNGVITFPNSGSGIMVGGSFAVTVNGQTYYNIARLNNDGTLDTSFSPGTGADGKVRALSWQPNNKILAGGEFAIINGLSYNHLVRFNADGSIDSTNFYIGSGANDIVYSINNQFEGIYIGGRFESVNGTLRRGFARLYSNGTVDTTFMDTAYNQFAGVKKIYANDTPTVFASASQSTGDLLIGGAFYQVGGGQLNTNVVNSLDDQLFISESLADPNLWVEPKTRDGFRNRTGFARLIGGSTPGPGNLALSSSTYSQNKSQSTLTVGLVRTNGTLGPISANFYVQPGTALAGQDYKYQAAPPIYWIAWDYLSSPSRMREDGLAGISGNLIDPLGLYLPLNDAVINNLSKVTISVIKNNLNPGNLNAQFSLVNPSLDTFFLGGEEIPLGAALGISQATLSLIDDTTYPGQFGFKSSMFVATNLFPAISVVRSNGTFGNVSMSYSTSNGTAISPSDYIGLTNRPLAFANTVVSNGFNVTINNNGSISSTEKSFNVMIFNLGTTPGATYGISNAVVRIINPNFQGYVTLSASNYIGTTSSGILNFIVNRVAGNLGQVTVDYQTTNGSAVNGVDYVGITNRLAWANGDVTPKTISVPLLPNQAVGGVKQFGVRLYASTLGGVTNLALMGVISNATLTITNDNSYGSLQLSSAFYNVNEGTNNYALITVVRSGGAVGSVSVNFGTASGSNTTANVNYAPTNGTLVFTNGQIAKSFRVYVLPDGITDPAPTNFYFNVNISNPTNAALGTITNTQVRILDSASYNRTPGSGDTGFTSPGMNGDVLSLSLNSSGQIIAAGNFTAVGSTGRGRIARLNQNGTLDTAFLAGLSGANAVINAAMCQTDDRVLVGGSFTTMDDVNRSFIARLMTDGSLDTSFNPGAGADSVVNAVAETFSGTGTNQVRKIYVGGAFGAINGTPSPGIERLNNDGSVDLGFNVGAGADGPIYAIAVYPTNSIYFGKVLIGGSFAHFNGTSISNLVRLNFDGSLDTNFDGALGTGANGAVHALAVQLDGKILAGGNFTSFNGTGANYLIRLNTDGSIDTAFLTAASGANGPIEAIALSADTRILASGQFTTFNGNLRNHITRLLPTGATDPAINFGTGANGDIASMVIQPFDDAIVIGGAFSQYNGVPYSHIARIYGGTVSGSGAFGFSSANYQIHESGVAATITILRTGGSSGPNADGSGNVSVQFITSDGTALHGTNYLSVSTNIVFPPGEVSETVQVPVLRDFMITPDLIANLTLTNPTAPAILSDTTPTALLTIVNDDTAVAFSSPTYTQVKNAATGVAVIDIFRLGGTNDTAMVDFYTTTNGTAVAGVDYYPTNATLTFNPGVSDVQVQVPIINNGLAEGNRTVTMILTNAINTALTSPSNATLTIIDTVTAPGQLYFSATNYTVNEGDGTAYLTVLRTNGYSGSVSVTYDTVAGTAQPGINYVTSSGQITFGSGDTSKQIPVPLVDNNLVQGTVSFSIVLSLPTGGSTLTLPSAANVSIIDNDTGFAFLSATNYVRETNGIVPIFVQRIGGTNGGVTVNYFTTNNGTAQAGINYTPVSGTLTFAVNEMLKVISLPLLYYPQVTGDLTLGMVLASPSGGFVVNPSNTLVVIQDADAGLSFTNSVLSVPKNIGKAVITVVCGNPSVEPAVNSNTVPMSVGFSTVDGTGAAGVDYIATNGVLMFTNGIATNTFDVPIINNSLVNGDHTFGVKLLNAAPAGIAQIVSPSNMVVTILDNNSGLSFSSPAYTVLKTGVSATITVNRTDNTNQVSSVAFTTSDGTAIGGVDYFATNGVLVFTNGETTKTFNVTILANTTVQPDKTILLQLFNPTNAFLIAPYAATLTIHDTSGSLVVPAGSTLIHESLITNGIIDPGENVTMWLALRASGGTNIPNVNATLLVTNGITSPSPSTAVNYGPMAVGGPAVSRQFSFTANGTNGQQVAATLLIDNGFTNIGTAIFSYTLGMWTNTFFNTNRITINDNAIASPYPSIITVSNVGGTLVKSTVTLSNMYQIYPAALNVLVVSPAGQDTLVMSHAGGPTNLAKVTLTFDDAAATYLSGTNALATSTNKPTQYSPTPFFP